MKKHILASAILKKQPKRSLAIRIVDRLSDVLMTAALFVVAILDAIWPFLLAFGIVYVLYQAWVVGN